MLPNNLRQASGEADADIQGQARQRLPGILHIPLQYAGHGSLIGNSFGLAVLTEIPQQPIGKGVSSVLRTSPEIKASFAIGGAAMELPVDDTLGLNAGLELVRTPKLADALGQAVSISIVVQREAVVEVYVDNLVAAAAKRHLRNQAQSVGNGSELPGGKKHPIVKSDGRSQLPVQAAGGGDVLLAPVRPTEGNFIDQRWVEDPSHSSAHVGTGDSVIQGERSPVVLLLGSVNTLIMAVQIHAAYKHL